MPLPLTDHPGYGAAMAQYQAAKTAAAETGDQAQINQVEMAWSQTVNRLQNELFDRMQAEQNRQQAIARAKQLVPNIPDAVLAGYTTPEQITAAAEAMKAQIDAATPPAPAPGTTPPPQQAPATQSWGAGPPTGATQGPPPDPKDPATFHKNMQEMASQIETQAGTKPQLVEKFGKEYFDSFILPGVVRRR